MASIDEILGIGLPLGIMTGATILIGIIAGVYHSFKRMFGYNNDAVFGDYDFKDWKLKGAIPESILKIAISIIIGISIPLGLIETQNKTVVFYIGSIGGIVSYIFFSSFKKIFGALASHVFSFAGWFMGLFFIGGCIMAITSDPNSKSTDFTGYVAMSLMLIGIFMFFPFCPFLWATHKIVYFCITPCLMVLRFKEIICSACFRYAFPLKSKYDLGIRRCEYCNQLLERTKERGKAIVTFGNYRIEQRHRTFVFANPDFSEKTNPVDVSEVYIDAKTVNKRLLETFMTYIRNYPPKYGLKSVKIFYKGDLDDLDHLKNLILNNFKKVTAIEGK